MNFRHLKYFVATAESKQVSRAALMMNISQSAITGAIKEIESELDTTLFLRSSKGMELTDEGRDFLQSAHEILDKFEQARKLTRKDSKISGNVKLAVSYTVIGYFLPEHLYRLKSFHPRLDIRVYEQTREEIEEGLLSERYDIAIILTSNTDHPEIDTETLQRSTRRLWLPNGHPLSQKHSVSFEEISKEPYIMLSVDEAAQTAMKYWSETPYRPNIRLRTSSIEAVRSMVANGEGVTILSDVVYRPWSLEGKRILTTSTSPESPTMDIGFALFKNREPSPATKALISYFHHNFQTLHMNIHNPNLSD